MATSKITAPRRGVNPNLLDNWLFAGGGSQQEVGASGPTFPINHRQQTMYTGTEWIIDRWRGTSVNSKIQLDPDGILIYGTPQNDEPQPGYMMQFVEWEALKGQTVTFSILYKESGAYVLKTKTGICPTAPPATSYTPVCYLTDLVSHGAGCGFYVHSNGTAYAQVGVAAGYSLKVVAVKLELGSMQTLARVNNEVYSLIDAPNYQDQQLRCLTSKAAKAENSAYRNAVVGTVSATGAPYLRWYQDDGTAYQFVVDSANGRLQVQTSTDGGANWTTMFRYDPVT